jgi:hypothetical protein
MVNQLHALQSGAIHFAINLSALAIGLFNRGFKMNKYKIVYNSSRILGNEKVQNLTVIVNADSDYNAVAQVAARNGLDWSTSIISVDELEGLSIGLNAINKG